jgi:hypothetical protein
MVLPVKGLLDAVPACVDSRFLRVATPVRTLV